MPKHEKLKSYGIAEDNFEGECVCIGCVKRCGTQLCSVYSPEGMDFRIRSGHCPIVRRYASWHKDKPIVKATKKRIGQGKTRQGGN